MSYLATADSTEFSICGSTTTQKVDDVKEQENIKLSLVDGDINALVISKEKK